MAFGYAFRFLYLFIIITLPCCVVKKDCQLPRVVFIALELNLTPLWSTAQQDMYVCWELTGLISRPAINAQNSRGADSRDQWTRRATGSTSSDEFSSRALNNIIMDKLKNPPVKKIRKSIEIWQTYGRVSSWFHFLAHPVGSLREPTSSKSLTCVTVPDISQLFTAI